MATKAVFVYLENHPELYDQIVKLAKENYTTPPSIVRRFIEKGLENEYLRVDRKKDKTGKEKTKKV